MTTAPEDVLKLEATEAPLGVIGIPVAVNGPNDTVSTLNVPDVAVTIIFQ